MGRAGAGAGELKTKATVPGWSATPAGHLPARVIEDACDGLSRRIRKKVPGDVSIIVVCHSYVYDGWNMVLTIKLNPGDFMNDSAYLDYWTNAARAYLSDQCFTPVSIDLMEYIESVSEAAQIWFTELNLEIYRDFDGFWGGAWLLNVEETSFASDFILHQLAGFCLSLDLTSFILTETEIETMSPIFEKKSGQIIMATNSRRMPAVTGRSGS